jgi:hypothetical protein
MLVHYLEKHNITATEQDMNEISTELVGENQSSLKVFVEESLEAILCNASEREPDITLEQVLKVMYSKVKD